ncbi:hypothetical protein HOLleu_04139 [Holothuria leucospilota]|uniref:Protein kinase domain-containing protein n=1 Tax=Holothuria leucospilota TaxID=206669 RepID=A0A9Q1CSX5_HOLLE|nr:hypothetical protein HOLleu_04139 [Holothuria leucospilota]
MIFSALFYRRKKRGKRQQSISKENATTPSGFESYEEPQERRTNFQTYVHFMPLPALPDKKRESIEDENVYYSDENESFTNRRVFQQRDLSFVLRLNSGSIYDRWIITPSKQNKSRLSTYFVASTVTVGNAAQKQITHWNDFAKRILEIPDVEFVVKTRGICIDGGCLYLIQDHIMCQTLEKYQRTKEGSGQLPSVSEFEIMRFINDILKGMEFIHSYGIMTLAKISMNDIDLSNDYMPMGGNET